MDATNYHGLPEDWALAVADVVNSTGAIRDGRYKQVNLAGAAVISAIQNAVGRHDVPYVFGGDGALVALAPADHDAAWSALATVQAWTRDELGLELRAGLVPVDAIRAAGHDVRLARHQVSDVIAYAMVAGGGARWADAELKAGRFRVPPAPAGARPDLTGLSCRWNPIGSRNGTIVSVIAVPQDDVAPDAFGALVTEILDTLAREDRDGHPVPDEGPAYRWPPAGLAEESAARAPAQVRGAERRRILLQAAIGRVSDLTGAELGGFDARRHRVDAGHNSDFRKFDDGLKLTVDVSSATGRRLEELLAAAAAAGTCRYGLHRQDEALMTCIVPSFRDRDHVHFIDGAAGGYAMAAAQLKAAAGTAGPAGTIPS